ncbi:MAG: dihydroorotate dehydrogenase-like protein [bacterium]|nr:dihydroorotate dehydrogenase-like protein [bacterium]
MDLTTNYMGLKLKNPLVAAASPLSYEIDNIKRMEEAGAAAVVLYSLFEEQIKQEALALHYYTTKGTESFAESLTYFPEPETYHLGPEEYLEHIRKAKAAVDLPVIASLNGITRGGWIDYARKVQQAGADGIELNVYLLPTNPAVEGGEIESVYVNILAAVKSVVSIPVAMKLNPFFSSIPNFAHKLDQMDVDALVLFNRFYQPDIDLEKLEVEPRIKLSTPGSMLLPMRWIAILYGHVRASLAATTGIHTAEDVIKTLMTGADVTQLCATLLRNGIGQFGRILHDMETWMDEHEYASVAQMKGSMSHCAVAEPAAFERANYMKALSGYRS